MPHFTRRKSPPELKSRDYRLYRSAVREDFRETCAYCLLEERWAAGLENFELDHFRPRSLFPQLALSFYNLYWSCHVCNKFKGVKWPSEELELAGIRLIDLCVDDFARHFTEKPSGMWVGRTKSARYTIEMLRLNRPHLVQLRRLIRTLTPPPTTH